MLSGEGNAGEWWKTTIALVNKKSYFARAAHFFCTFLCRCFARLQHETSRNFLVTRFMEEMSYVFSFTFFLHCHSFSPCIGGRWHFPFCHRRYKIFMLFFQTKMSLLFFISRSRPLSPFFSLSFTGLPPTLSFSLSFSCSIFQICGHDN